MGMAKKIRMVLLERDMTVKQLSDLLGFKGNHMFNKLQRDNFTEEDLKAIAEALNCDFEGTFTLRDTGKKI